MEKQIKVWIGISLLTMMMACSNESTEVEQEDTTGQKQEEQKQEQKNTSPESPKKEEKPKTDTESLPPAKELEVTVEGQVEKRTGTLNNLDNYTIYVLDNFTVEKEEPGKDVLLSNYDGEFFVRIEKLDREAFDLDSFKSEINSLKDSGAKVHDLNPADLYHPDFRDAKTYLLAEYREGNAPGTNVLYVIKEFDGELFKLELFIPSKEAAEGIVPNFWAMLATINPS